MASPYVLSNYQIQFLSSLVATRTRFYLAAYQPVQFLVQSTDLLLDTQGNPTAANDVDLLAAHRAPYAPQANLGPNRIGFVGEALFFDGARSTQRGNLAATGHTWSWTGSPTVTTYAGPYSQGSQAKAIWSTPGLYTVSLTVTDRFGSSTTGTRQVMIYADRESAPKGITGLSGMTGSISQGGWTAQLVAAATLTGLPRPDSLPVGTYLPVAVMAETEYEVTPGNWLVANIGPYAGFVPGQWYEDQRILFAGYIVSGEADEDPEKDTVQYSLQTADVIARAAGVHNIGYYNTVYATRAPDDTPLTLKHNPPLGHGQLVADLSSEDVYRSLLGDHSTLGQYHDVILWRDWLPQDKDPLSDPKHAPLYWLTYSTLTAPEGSIWDAMTAVAQNEYASLWCERDSSFRVGPLLNMRGYEVLGSQTVYGFLPNSSLLNLTAELNTGTGATDAAKAAWAAKENYLHFFWGPSALPQAIDSGPAVNATRDVSVLKGPPIAFHLADAPVYDSAPMAPADGTLFPWVVANWPQDIAVHPLTLVVPENYTNRTAFVKNTMTMPLQNNQWTGWYPLGYFDQQGNVLQSVPAGVWTVYGAGSTNVLPDVTIAGGATQRTLVWGYIWEMSRRLYATANSPYTVTAQLSAAPWLRLGDLFLVSRQRALDGPQFSAKPFQLTQVTYSIDLAASSWTAEVQGAEVTTYQMGPLITPPFAPPKN